MSTEDTLVVITRNGMGDAEPELQQKLLSKWIQLTLENDQLPGALALYTRGVLAACEGSPALEGLQALDAKGVPVILCKTCIDAFDVADEVRVGIVGGMGDIIAAQIKAGKVVHL